ncbi:universal stress protein [Pseudogemmobacter sp. W21_MBD1_M6]|uniref:universal stress protein n=1 Tax=Pseudogemmobacter sp. W21_MBD1_M6 TaxID=3240271 RepID=UPI003F9D0B8A
MTKIIALVDGSTYSQSVCDHAVWVAKGKTAQVEVVHVLGRREGGAPSNLSGNIGLGARTALLAELAELDAARAKLAQKRGRAILEDAKARIEAAGVTEVTTKLRNGDLVETLLAMEADAYLVIIGKRGEAADFAKMHLGSNLERVVRSSKKPVLVASRAFQPVNDFLIAFDGGASALKAVEHVAQSKLFVGLKCHVLTVGEATTEAKRKLEGAAAVLRDAGYDVDTDIVSGQADVVISERVKSGKADLLVMGAYGHSRIRSLIIGSTTTEMIRSCPIPILLFR